MAMENARQKGIQNAYAKDTTAQERLRIHSGVTWAGLKIMAFVSFVVLLFLYNEFFRNDSRLFWMIVALLMCALLIRFGRLIKEDGAQLISAI